MCLSLGWDTLTQLFDSDENNNVKVAESIWWLAFSAIHINPISVCTYSVIVIPV